LTTLQIIINKNEIYIGNSLRHNIVHIKNILEDIAKYIEGESQKGKELTIYKVKDNPPEYFKEINIKIELDECKEIILQEETKLELGGAYKQSFSIIFPLTDINLVQNNKITVLGPEIRDITARDIDFGMFVLLGVKKISEKIYNELLHFNFISNGIEGFMIRTIPRRFWCRISEELINKGVSFELLGNAIAYLYKQKFKDVIDTMELFIVNSHPDSVLRFIELTEEIRSSQRTRWKEKIEKWKQNIDCDYDWDCAECPYIETCDDVREVLDEREKIEE